MTGLGPSGRLRKKVKVWFDVICAGPGEGKMVIWFDPRWRGTGATLDAGVICG